MLTCELTVNGETAGIKLAKPYRFDITGLVKLGVNKIKVKVYNSLANHYNIGFPTYFVFNNQTVSGLIGPVTIKFLSPIEINAKPLPRSEIKKITKSNGSKKIHL